MPTKIKFQVSQADAKKIVKAAKSGALSKAGLIDLVSVDFPVNGDVDLDIEDDTELGEIECKTLLSGQSRLALSALPESSMVFPKTRLILALDGGGLRNAWFTTQLLYKWSSELQTRGMALSSCISAFAATGSGAILAAGLATGVDTRKFSHWINWDPRPPRTGIVNVFREFIYFGFLHKMYRARHLKSDLKDCFGERTLGDCKFRLLILNSKVPLYFDSEDNADRDLSLVDVLLRSSAAPQSFSFPTTCSNFLLGKLREEGEDLTRINMLSIGDSIRGLGLRQRTPLFGHLLRVFSKTTCQYRWQSVSNGLNDYCRLAMTEGNYLRVEMSELEKDELEIQCSPEFRSDIDDDVIVDKLISAIGGTGRLNSQVCGKHKIFISYSIHDREMVDPVIAHLKTAGHKVWMESHELESALRWNAEVMKELAQSHFLVFFASKKSCRSTWAERELALAFREDLGIIPVLLEDCKPHGVGKNVVEDLQRIDARNRSPKEVASYLSNVLAQTSPLSPFTS